MPTDEAATDEAKRSQLSLDDLLPEPRFREVHTRMVDLPIEVVWPAALSVRAGEVRAMGPLTAMRDIPARLRRSRRVGVSSERSMLEELADQGFSFARRDDRPIRGQAEVLCYAAGRFWSPSMDAADPLGSVEEFQAYDTPGSARVAGTLAAIDRGGITELVTETRITGTDDRADRTFRRYWIVIRYPSGLIRRSWLAAIERRAHRVAGE